MNETEANKTAGPNVRLETANGTEFPLCPLGFGHPSVKPNRTWQRMESVAKSRGDTHFLILGNRCLTVPYFRACVAAGWVKPESVGMTRESRVYSTRRELSQPISSEAKFDRVAAFLAGRKLLALYDHDRTIQDDAEGQPFYMESQEGGYEAVAEACMRAGDLIESVACAVVDFDHLDTLWRYWLDEGDNLHAIYKACYSYKWGGIAWDRVDATIRETLQKLPMSDGQEVKITHPRSPSCAGEMAVEALKHAAEVARDNNEPQRAHCFEALASRAGNAPVGC